MNLSKTAEDRLKHLLPVDSTGFSVADFVGTCRGSTPVIQPAQAANADQEIFKINGITFYLNPGIADRFRTCDLDYDRSFLGKGLTASWPQCDECACHS